MQGVRYGRYLKVLVCLYFTGALLSTMLFATVLAVRAVYVLYTPHYV